MKHIYFGWKMMLLTLIVGFVIISLYSPELGSEITEAIASGVNAFKGINSY